MQIATVMIQRDLEAELQNILSYWKEYSIDEVQGGFWAKETTLTN
ncbi:MULTISPECIES: hypothetical protein [Salegentibacter]|jgi:mannobiose 2-epimerase|nr:MULTISPECIES: hypothetical protein [Salegentibacter]|tara:strand:- start:724 stop:858 length:135 start_codon:yes stop_codon:yes gene_type:complete